MAPPENKPAKRPGRGSSRPPPKGLKPLGPPEKDGTPEPVSPRHERLTSKSARTMPTAGKNKLGHDDAGGNTPPPEIRTGSEYQAVIPDYVGPRPPGTEGGDPRAGRPGPNTLEALALAASYEKEMADKLPLEAVRNVDQLPGMENDPNNLLVERGQRSRKKPRKWVPGDGQVGQPRRRVTADDEATDDEVVIKSAGRGSKRSAPKSTGERKSARRKAAKIEHKSSGPRVLKWELMTNGFLSLEIENNGKLYTGALVDRGDIEPAEMVEEEDSQAETESEPNFENIAKRRRGRPSKAARRGRAHSVGNTDESSDEEPVKEKRASVSAEKPKQNVKRRIQANQEWERMASEGPAPDTMCALCHRPAEPSQDGSFFTEQARGEVDFDLLERKHDGMGPMLLVKSSAIMNAWVHLQCALWSPEVYVNTNGDIERASEAIRRGRMLKCKCCNEKGATLGCHKRSCRASYHLPCARENGCQIEGAPMEDYLVTCKEHAFTNDLVDQMPMPSDARDPVGDRDSRGGSAARSRSPYVPSQQTGSEAPSMGPSSGLEPQRAAGEQDQPEVAGNPPQNQPAEGGEGLASLPQGPLAEQAYASGWNELPKDTQNLDTLTAAAVAMKQSTGMEAAANPLAAHHFGGTVGQSNLRPGRCAVCVVQRKGVCGTLTAPRKCLRRLALDAAGRAVPEAPPGWRTRRPQAYWPAEPARPSGTNIPLAPAPAMAFVPANERADSGSQPSGHATGLTPPGSPTSGAGLGSGNPGLSAY